MTLLLLVKLLHLRFLEASAKQRHVFELSLWELVLRLDPDALDCHWSDGSIARWVEWVWVSLQILLTTRKGQRHSWIFPGARAKLQLSARTSTNTTAIAPVLLTFRLSVVEHPKHLPIFQETATRILEERLAVVETALLYIGAVICVIRMPVDSNH